jgi:RecA/RadA recombinase
MSKVEEKEKLMTESEAWRHLEDLFGSDSVIRPDEVIKTDIIRTKTPSLDRALGVGGWPRGRLVQLAGAPSSGKTLLALLAIAEWQSKDPENCAVFIDAEYTYSSSWAAKFGVDNDRVYLVKGNEAAKIFGGLVGRVKKNQATGKLTKVPGLFDMISSGQKITYVHPDTKKKLTLDCGKMGVVVLDSIANLQVPQEVEAEVGKSLMAAVARFLTVELKKLTSGIAKSNVLMIGINQVRVDPGQMFGNPECLDPMTTRVKVRHKVMDMAIYQEYLVHDLFSKFVKNLDYNRPENIDVSDLNLEIESFDFEKKEIVWERINNLIVKEPVLEHYQLGDLRGTGGHLVYNDSRESFIRLDAHPDAIKVSKPINVVDFSINRVKNYFANGHLNHNTTPGGKALKHACSVMVEVGPISGSDNLILDSREEKQGHKIRAKVTKNKLGPPFKVAEFFVDFRSGVVRKGEELLDLGVKLNIFERPNNRSYIICSEKLSSRESAIQFCEDNSLKVEELIRDFYINGGDSSLEETIEESQSSDPLNEAEENS